MLYRGSTLRGPMTTSIKVIRVKTYLCPMTKHSYPPAPVGPPSVASLSPRNLQAPPNTPSGPDTDLPSPTSPSPPSPTSLPHPPPSPADIPAPSVLTSAATHAPSPSRPAPHAPRSSPPARTYSTRSNISTAKDLPASALDILASSSDNSPQPEFFTLKGFVHLFIAPFLQGMFYGLGESTARVLVGRYFEVDPAVALGAAPGKPASAAAPPPRGEVKATGWFGLASSPQIASVSGVGFAASVDIPRSPAVDEGSIWYSFLGDVLRCISASVEFRDSLTAARWGLIRPRPGGKAETVVGVGLAGASSTSLREQAGLSDGTTIAGVKEGQGCKASWARLS
ncbi:hypothetical protein BDK51DRAFT_35133 [Blyttiomyces helicus]|uniref:Uncharacterized protein n=1 Tax=Blyttiomyces helicus TaxID=388810 RepID=A0A4P9WL80_9FUNG|nr:hypothetical protein BDK51DRAFT_35133 [Blyttiomyces helicus]|eukprot:RKO93789.1 hypothetical protein BDK51DRAFT_35133 [Blyttiomyces helicus]